MASSHVGGEDSGVDALIQAADDLAVGRLTPEDLPMLAAEALARGVDSPSLRALAGLGREDVREARDLFDEAMTELGHPPGSTERALLTQLHRAAMDLLDGSTSEPEAAAAIAGILHRLARRAGQHRWGELRTRFDLLQAHWKAAPELRADTRTAIRTAVHDLLKQLDDGQPMP